VEPWQELLKQVFEQGQQWVYKHLLSNDWRRKILKRWDEARIPISFLTNDYEFQAWLSTPSYPAQELRKGFVMEPGKHCPLCLPMLVPFSDSNGSTTHLSLQLGFLTENAGSYFFYGYRYESPEKQGIEHQFFHAQPIGSFGHGKKYASAVGAYPDTFPAFPLAARDPLELVASVLVANWEWGKVEKLLTSSALNQQVKNRLKDFLQRLLELNLMPWPCP